MSSSIGMGVVKGKMCLLPAFTLEWCFNLQQPHVFPNIRPPPSHKAPPGVSWSTVPAGTVFHALGVARGARVHRAPRSCGVTYRSKVSMASVRTYVSTLICFSWFRPGSVILLAQDQLHVRLHRSFTQASASVSCHSGPSSPARRVRTERSTSSFSFRGGCQLGRPSVRRRTTGECCTWMHTRRI